MADTSWREGQGAMTPERLRGYVDELATSHKSSSEIEQELMQFGLDRNTAASMVRDALDAQWIEEGGGGPALGQVGPKHMIAGLLLMAAGGAATFASIYAVFTFDVEIAYIFYGAIVAGAIDFTYGLIRFLDG